MKTFKQIINEELLNEAIKIENGKQALDLVLNKKIGVKVRDGWNVDNQEIKNQIIEFFNYIINTFGNDAIYTIQWIVNKDNPSHAIHSYGKNKESSDALKEMISCRKKPWAKEVPGFNDISSLNSKEVPTTTVFHNLEKALQEEGQKHGKHNKGSGEIKDVKKVYDDGTWTLQLPLSFEGAKAASYYGKEGEEQHPTHWCTRADKRYYNMYREDSPLYIIRNMKTGKAYQISFNESEVNFLDQDDVKGDEITKGDVTDIPDDLLDKIKFNNKSLKDYKHNFQHKLIVKKGQIRYPTDKLSRAEWSQEIPVSGNIVKRIWTNFKSWDAGEKDPYKEYMIRNKNHYEGEKHNGQWAVKYYNKSNPKLFVLFNRIYRNYRINYFEGEHPIAFNKACEEIEKVAKKDFGVTKDKERTEQKNKETEDFSNLVKKFKEKSNKELVNNVEKETKKVEEKYLKGSNLFIKSITTTRPRSFSGGFLPQELIVSIREKPSQKYVAGVSYMKEENHLKYKIEKNSYFEHSEWYNELKGIFNGDIDKVNNFENDLSKAINLGMMNYSKKIVKDKNGSYLRLYSKVHRNDGYKEGTKIKKDLQYEEYFPY